jgi:NitT/TauT family transport system permease protein
VYSWVNSRSIAKLFLLTQGRGVTGFTSSLQKFRRGIFYSVLISALIFLGFGIAAAVATAPKSVQFPSVQNLLTIESGVLVGLVFSLARVWYVYFLAVLGGVPLGIAIALRTRLYDVMVPVLEVVASIPAPALLPVIYVAAAGQGEVVAAVVIFLGMIWYIIFNTMAGIRTLPAEIFELRRAFHISAVKAWRDIYLPASATAFVTGSITAIGAGWNTLIIAEYFNIPSINPSSKGLFTQVNTGIGKIITLATTGNPADLVTLYLAIASMTLLIVAVNLTVWRRAYHYTTRRYAYNR